MFTLCNIVMKLCGHVKEHPGPKPSSNQNLSICHWNLGSTSVYNHLKLSVLRAYLSTYKFYVIYQKLILTLIYLMKMSI